MRGVIDPSGPLAHTLASGSIGDLIAPDSPAFTALDSAARRYVRPWSVAVVGRRGVGRDTMARALHERWGLAAVVADEPDTAAGVDLHLHLLAGAPRLADRRILDAAPPGRTVVVIGKVDTLAPAAVERARAAAESLGQPVVAVSQLLACADMSDAELGFLRKLVADGEAMPSMSGHFLAGAAPQSPAWQMRTELLKRLDATGIDIAMGLLRTADPGAADATTLTDRLHAASGFDVLGDALRSCSAAITAFRDAQVRAVMEVTAAAGDARDVVEMLLRTAGV